MVAEANIFVLNIPFLWLCIMNCDNSFCTKITCYCCEERWTILFGTTFPGYRERFFVTSLFVFTRFLEYFSSIVGDFRWNFVVWILFTRLTASMGKPLGESSKHFMIYDIENRFFWLQIDLTDLPWFARCCFVLIY